MRCVVGGFQEMAKTPDRRIMSYSQPTTVQPGEQTKRLVGCLGYRQSENVDITPLVDF